MRQDKEDKVLEMLEYLIANKHKRTKEEEQEYRNKILELYKNDNEER